MRWFEKQRMEWLKNRQEPFNRVDLMAAFDISMPQASNDIQKYLEMFPNTFIYNPKKKRYEVSK